jgi:hypothetical protein
MRRQRPPRYRNLYEFASELVASGLSEREVAEELARAGRRLEEQRDREWAAAEEQRRRQLAQELREEGNAAGVARATAILGWEGDGGPDGSLPTFSIESNPFAPWLTPDGRRR